MPIFDDTIFTDQIAVITGASSGIGRAIALGLAAAGARLCLIGRNPETLEKVIAGSQAISTQVQCYQADLTQDNDILNLAASIRRDFGAIDLLIHSAGVISIGQIKDASIDEFDWQYRVNLRAPYLLTQALLPMIKPHQGQIVFLNSRAGSLNGRAGLSQYAATKHGLRVMADSLREEVNAEGIRVLSVYPSRTATPMQATLYELEGRVYQPEHLLQPENVAKVVLNALSLPRPAEVTEIAIKPMTISG